MAWILPSILVGLGTISTDLGEPVQAIAFLRETVALAKVRGNLGDVMDGIGGLARLVSAIGQAVEAVRLFAAADAIREGLAMPLAPSEREDFESIMNGLRAALSADCFAVAWAEGRALLPEEAIAKALALEAEPAASTPPPAE
jgi:hypothetical protein